ncbi:efflux RND transporter periplasmic adaptor subunit [Neorickettsia sennetsu]|uniref:Efflux transporter, RND family, MFP subunit n=1 Tax=Ehrlichia sennetsu (strain ATCC VR-367 / Miyayama) TaxID=222891 RepID=Q2GEP7_EHRS3|nr:efflux RND transporter periplasmic adaptor subunit [Neorickettsia sennetsu]ABD46000.1 efflux transporter, RND family, MFP subunit [Neorickettsia sennetsu str. Miyayama]
MRFVLPTVLFGLVLLVLAFKFIGGGVRSENEKAVSEASSLRTMVVEPVLRAIVVNGYGTVDAAQRYFLYSQVSGEVVEKLAGDGQILQEGDTLLRLNSEVCEAQLESLKALLEERKIEYRAAKELKDSGHSSEVKLSAALAGLKKAEADLKALERQMEKHAIKAPVSGVLGKINVAVGDVVSPGATLIAELIPFGNYIVRMNVSEADILNLREGMEVEIILPEIGAVNGRTRFVSLVPSGPTGTFPVEIVVEDNEWNRNRVPLGMVVDTRVVIGRKFLYKVPASALFLGKDGKIAVEIFKDGLLRPIEVGIVEEEGENFWIQQSTVGGQLEVVVAGGGVFRRQEIKAS